MTTADTSRRVPPAQGTGADDAIRLSGVRKSFGDIVAVDGLDLAVAPASCLGLLGPNGAGKSTTMRLLTAQAIADSGTIDVLGHPIPQQAKQARARMGVVPQIDNLDAELSARQNLTVFSYLYRVPAGQRRAAVQRSLEIAQLVDRADTKVDNLSGGMKRRLLIARSLVHQPELVLLDEPTVGLDPQVRQELWTLIDGLRSAGVTVLMSTHYIEEAERLADNVAIMDSGRVIAKGTPAELRGAHAGDSALEFYGPPLRLAEVERCARSAGLVTRRTGPSVSVLRAELIPPSVLTELGEGTRRPATLEDVFVTLTGEEVS